MLYIHTHTYIHVYKKKDNLWWNLQERVATKNRRAKQACHLVYTKRATHLPASDGAINTTITRQVSGTTQQYSLSDHKYIKQVAYRTISVSH